MLRIYGNLILLNSNSILVQAHINNYQGVLYQLANYLNYKNQRLVDQRQNAILVKYWIKKKKDLE